MSFDFHKWVEQHDATVSKAAEERIVALLEIYLQELFADANKLADEGYNTSWHRSGIGAVQNCLALIKGEQK